MKDEPRFGLLDNAQPYSSEQLAAIAREARPFVLGPKDAGKVYCPFCRLREARWRRSTEPSSPRIVDLFVYCTQCHKTGVTKIDLDARVEPALPRSVIWLALGWALVVFLMRSPVITSDGVQYAIDARAGEELYNPHHLLYTRLLRAIFAALDSVSNVDLLEVARASSSAWFALLLFGVGLAVSRRVDERRLPVIAMFAVASLFGFQQFAAQPEPYTAAVACAVFAFAFAHRLPGNSGIGSAIGASLALALGALFHQLGALAGVAILCEGALRERSAFKRAIGICASGAVVVVVAYLLAWRADVRGETFSAFLTRYSGQGPEGWGDVANLSATGLSALGISLRTTICGFGRVGASAVSGFIVAACLAVVFVVSIVRFSRSPRRSPAVAACLAAGLIYEGFCWWWIPSLAKYQLFAIIPLLVVTRDVASTVLSARRLVGVERLAVLVLVLVNLFGCLVPERSERHLPRERAFALAAEAGVGGVVICDTETAQFVEWDHPDVAFVPAALALANAANGTLTNSIDSIYDPLAKSARIVIPLLEIKPTYVGGGLPGPAGARVWNAYLGWIVGVRRERDGGMTRRRFEVATLANGEPAIVLDAARVPMEDLFGVVAQLDRALIAAFGDPPPFSFERFFESAGWPRR